MSEPTRARWKIVGAAVCAGFAAVLLRTAVQGTHPRREALEVLEGELACVSTRNGERLRLAFKGYLRHVELSSPADRVATLHTELNHSTDRFRALVAPTDCGHATLVQLERVGDPEPLLSYDEVWFSHRRNDAAGGWLGLILALLALSLLRDAWLSRQRDVRYPPGAVCRQFDASCLRMWLVFSCSVAVVAGCGWGIATLGEVDLVLSGVMRVILCGLGGPLAAAFCLWLVPWLIPGRAALVVDEAGLDDRFAYGRIRWEDVTRLELRRIEDVDYLVVTVSDPDAHLDRCSWLVRQVSRFNEACGHPAISICLFPLAATKDELAAVIGSHGVTLHRQV